MNTKSTGLKSIAAELKLSINTVSRALRDCDDISDATKQRVREKAYELGYLPNNVSQFIKRDGKKLIAIVLNSMTNMYNAIISEKLMHLFDEKKFDYTVVYSKRKKMTLETVKQCISQRVDGIISLLEPDDQAVDTARLNEMPIILIGRNVPKDYVDDIYTDDTLGGSIAGLYLANFHHINKFIYIKMRNVECSKRRYDAFLEAVKSINPESECIEIDERQINSNLIKYITQGFLGIFCFNDELAYRALKVLNKEVPNVRKVYPRLHIIGYDCISTKVEGFVDVTSIDFDYDAICEEALLFLEERFKNPKREKQSKMFTVRLHQRKIF